jgi:hypothetical protein
MSATIREIIDTEDKTEIIIAAFEQYIKRCKTNAKATLNGYGNASSQLKREQWEQRCEQASELLNELLNELS